MKLFSFIVIFMSGLFLTGCFVSEDKNKSGAVSEIQELKGEIFGSYYIIRYNGKLDQEKFTRELDIFFKDFNQEFSNYQEDSLISKFNKLPASQKLKATERFIWMLKFCQEMSDKTEGAFDPTIRPVIRLWGFGGGAEAKATPSDSDLKTAMKKTGMRHIHWNENSLEVWKSIDGAEIDTNAFAPGWAADLMGELLEKHHVHNFMVDVSGEILIRGEKRPGVKWLIGIEKPSQNYGEGVQVVIGLKDQAIATSGNYRQFFDEKGQRKSHIIDPRTGKSVSHQISSASVITKNSAEADAWSTAFMVLGEKGMALAEKHQLKVNLLKSVKADEVLEIRNSAMEEIIKNTDML